MSDIPRNGLDHNGSGNGRARGFLAEDAALPAPWVAFINYCQHLQHGELEKVKIQDGLPVVAEFSVKKIKFA